ncbi:hypothetical protein EEL32_22455 [Brevibacillus laterosporus]|uniref:Large ribosomal subunit protein bL12 C-terminal domain-containing protein n=1 Tax=Brevibacillus laterosporus TaxID=1465 RepID=A0A502HV37_BRELA|nr:ribosomal protein L7/L12 [Brevibacillus laterosporus]QDX93563.1 hypothetical protein EEL30_15435 [Brevibacillus laterosporus]RAP30569.1 hypothetical protein C2W64_01765 [Brevibacillus laterosporus]TPG73310.1 hypothetical protein EEL31_02780 [Brevibacillus laterosporus]TPG77693.1 hypothetical protein EEL32_22455 [Brevibacillus laterosporus]
MEFALIMALLCMVFLLFEKVSTLRTQLKKMNVILQQIATQVGVPDHPIDTKLRMLLIEGKKIEAIKEAREVLGLSLKEAKEYVESL